MAEEPRYDFLVSTIVPAMNEEGNIDEFCRQYAEMLESAPFKSELVYVDDGSNDYTIDTGGGLLTVTLDKGDGMPMTTAIRRIPDRAAELTRQ